MADYLFLSRYRITYTPTGGVPLILLDVDDFCDGPLSLAADLTAQVEQPILAAWAAHCSRGNAQMQLAFTHYGTAATREAAQLAGIHRQMHMASHPEGVLLLETAFAGPTSQATLHLRATLTHVSWQDQSGNNEAKKLWLAMSYAFLISPADELRYS